MQTEKTSSIRHSARVLQNSFDKSCLLWLGYLSVGEDSNCNEHFDLAEELSWTPTAEELSCTPV